MGGILLALIFIGLNTYKDYGISWDEEVSRRNGLISLKYVLSFFSIFPDTQANLSQYSDLFSYKDRDYPVLFEIILAITEQIYRFDSPKEVFEFRHLATYICWLTGVFFIYLTARKIFYRNIYILFSVLFYILQPRLYGEAYYNDKDIVFMSFFAISTWACVNLINNPTHRTAAIAGICAALAINVRIMAVVIPFLLIFQLAAIGLLSRKFFNHTKLSLTFLATCAAITYILWPYLWLHPIDHFSEAFSNMAHFRWNGAYKFNGVQIPAAETPEIYGPVWILITTPLVIVSFALLGGGLTSYEATRSFLKSTLRTENFINLFLLSVPLSSLLAVAILHSILYDGWRQLYFVYPSIALLSGIGFFYVDQFLSQNAMARGAVRAVVAFSFLLLCHWMYVAHPLQNVFFNSLTKAETRPNNWEIDYWGLANKLALKHILSIDDSRSIKVGTGSATPAPRSALMLPQTERNRLDFQKDACDATYIINSFRAVFDVKIDQYAQSYRLIWQKTIGDMPVIRIYQRNEDVDAPCPFR